MSIFNKPTTQPNHLPIIIEEGDEQARADAYLGGALGWSALTGMGIGASAAGGSAEWKAAAIFGAASTVGSYFSYRKQERMLRDADLDYEITQLFDEEGDWLEGLHDKFDKMPEDEWLREPEGQEVL